MVEREKISREGEMKRVMKIERVIDGEWGVFSKIFILKVKGNT